MTHSWIERSARFFASFALGSILAIGVLATASPSVAHSVGPEEAIAELGGEQVRTRFDIVSVERSGNLPRLLIVRVGPAWASVAASERAEAAESWHHLWQAGVKNGVLAIVDNATEKSVVTFDAHGKAQVRTVADPTVDQAKKRPKANPVGMPPDTNSGSGTGTGLGTDSGTGSGSGSNPAETKKD